MTHYNEQREQEMKKREQRLEELRKQREELDKIIKQLEKGINPPLQPISYPHH